MLPIVRQLTPIQAILVLALTLCFGLPALATDTQLWNKSNESSDAVIDHSAWQTFLSSYLVINPQSGVNLVRYQAVTDADQQALEAYLTMMQSIDPRNYSKKEQMAYWINLYNALTVDLILENYPVKSITKLGEGFFSFGPWDDDAASVAGHKLTLNDIEHKILRPIWKDPRIHYAVNCASYGCPNLSATAYTSANLESLLNDGAKNYVNHQRGVRIEGDELVLSKIYKWYQEDFGRNESEVINHLVQYAQPDLKAQLRAFKAKGDGDIEYEYDWNLNEPK